MPKIIDDEKVYRAAMQAVIERGYAGATTKQIAEAAGISEGLVRVAVGLEAVADVRRDLELGLRSC